MRETIAIAAYERNREQVAPFAENDLVKWNDAPDGLRQRWLSNADAVLRAMREPTEAMLSAGASADQGEGFSTIEWIGDAWRDMIDAASE